jgi:hypothetical protein
MRTRVEMNGEEDVQRQQMAKVAHSKTKAVNATCTSFSVYDQDKDIVGNGDAQSSPTSTTQMFQGYQTYNKTPISARTEEHMPTKTATQATRNNSEL